MARYEKSALKDFARMITFDGINNMGPSAYLNRIGPEVINVITQTNPVKVKMIFAVFMEKVDLNSGETIIREAQFHSNIEITTQSSDLNDIYDSMIKKCLENMAKFQRDGSNWRFKNVSSLQVYKVDYHPIKGSSFIKLPRVLELKKGTINVKNDDNQCFKWSVLRAMNQKIDTVPYRVSKRLRSHENDYNWNGIKFPTELKNISIFEKNNPTLSINVFGYDGSIFPLRISKTRSTYVNLLLISDGDNEHYCVISNISRLLSSQVSRHGHKRYFCYHCLNSFTTEKVLKEHEKLCINNEPVRLIMPEKETYCAFKNYQRSIRVPNVIYADFEAFLSPVNLSKGKSTNKYQKHNPSGFCYYIKGIDESPTPIIYNGDNVGEIFMKMIEKSVKEIYKPPHKKVFTDENEEEFNNARICYVCKDDMGIDKTRDHCQITGKFRGSAHKKCSRLYIAPKFVPVIMHNLSGYDTHLFIKNLGVSEGEVSCIPNTDEKYISFSKEIKVDEYITSDGELIEVKQTIKFIDSFKFMSNSLSTLVGNLNSDQFNNLEKYTDNTHLLKRKGVYPYEYMSSLEKFNDTQLPPQASFYSRLNDEHITDEDYKHAQNVWKTFDMKTMKDYHNLYLKTDVLLLADVFESFRDLCLENYQLDPAWYYTAPGLAWDAALKKTNIYLELLNDPDMLLMFEKGIRGGVSTISNRYAKANNKYMGDDYNKNEESKYLQYLDANNLYGWAMSQPLPTHGFKWMNKGDIKHWESITSEEGVGCILEVDLEYSKELHDLHNEYPLAPESLSVGGINKLIPNLNNKTNYIVHYKNLKQYRDLGMKITTIHRGIVFKERQWLKEYIDLNTNLRTLATNDFEKDFFKLMNNSVFGKTMENIRNRVSIHLVTSKRKAEKLVCKTNFKHLNIFDDNLIAVHMKKTKLTYNKPLYLGMCILDLSKSLMYDFHYNYIKDKYNDKAKLMFTDTDSLLYEIRTNDFYEDIKPDVNDKFDTSNFNNNHPSGIQIKNKKVIGMFKDEAGGKIIEEFVGLRAKLYSYKMHDTGEETKKCKGVKTRVVDRHISHQDYKNCLFDGIIVKKKMSAIRSYKHDLYTEEINKVALSSDDDKRIILDNKINTYAYGHYDA